MVGVRPGGYGEDSLGGEDAVEFADAVAWVMGQVDEGAGEGVGDAFGGDVWDRWFC